MIEVRVTVKNNIASEVCVISFCRAFARFRRVALHAPVQ